MSSAIRSRLVLLAASLFCFLTILPAAKGQAVRTGYSTLIAAGSGKCLDISGASTSSGAPAIQWHCNFNANEEWIVRPYGGAFRIIQQQTGQCLVVQGGSTTSGAPLVQNVCSGANGELWSFVPIGANFQFVNKTSSLCASVAGASTGDAAAIVQATCSTSPSSLWAVSSGLLLPSSATVLQASHSGQCMNVSGATLASGANIIQWPCAGAWNEQWQLVPSGAKYQVRSSGSGLCVTVSGSTSSASVTQAACNTASTDLWSLNPIGGSYQLAAQVSGLCLAVSGASQSPAASLVQTSCGPAQNQLWSLSPATIPSQWTSVIPLPVNPIAVANLPNGQLLMWSAYDTYTFEADIGQNAGQTWTATFDPSTGVSTQILVTNTGDDMFCPGTANLADGRILVNGGSSSPKTSIYSPVTGLWTSSANMNISRGYEGDTLLTDGSVLTYGGSWSGAPVTKTAEVWADGKGWSLLSGVPADPITGPDPQGVYRGDNHLWLFTVADGLVFHAGPSAPMHWITTAGAGSVNPAGNRGDDPFAINGKAVLYDVGLILKTGGAPAYQDANATASTYLINVNNGATVTKLAPMAYPRAFANGVVLPNGQVVILGGQTYAVPFTDTTSIFIPEIWDPVTQVFRQLNPMQTPRNYHSTAILLPDGRVFEGGGGQCGLGCSANHFDTEILTPPYLLNADGTPATRPRITSAPSTVTAGGTVSVNTDSPVVSFALMRLSSATHSVNNDQRRVPLSIQSVNGATSYTLTIPSNRGIVLPGYYWLFALNAQGVPSVAATLLIN